MRVLVTGSSGHLGEALMRVLGERGDEPVGLDLLPGPFTDIEASIADRDAVRQAMAGTDAVLHAATLHKPHVATHDRRAFVETNVAGTLNLLEAAAAAGVRAFVYTSTTSVFGDALVPAAGAPAAWIAEEVQPIPKNIYGVTKEAAENLCRLFHRNQGLAAIVLRTSRFFPEEDDDLASRAAFADGNLKANELLYRRVDIEDVVLAHLLAVERAPALGFGCYVVSATTPFAPDDLPLLRSDAAAVVRKYVPEFEAEYARRGWRMAPGIDRVYVNRKARDELGWAPRHDFRSAIARLAAGEALTSPLARLVGAKGYHGVRFDDGPYPVEPQRRSPAGE